MSDSTNGITTGHPIRDGEDVTELCAKLNEWTRELFKFGGKLGSKGDYDGAQLMWGYCDTLRRWMEGIPDCKAPRGDHSAPVPRKSMESASSQVSRSAKNSNATKKHRGRVKPGGADFTRVADRYLVRSGVSLKNKKSYRHKVPSDLIAPLAEACIQCSVGKSSFTMKDLKSNPGFKLALSKEYSVGYFYDVLKWFDQIGFVESGGRRGRYTLGEVYGGAIDCIGELQKKFAGLAVYHD